MIFKKIKAVICWIISSALIIFSLAGIIFGYIIRGFNPEGELTDGFGRLLYDSPSVINIIIKSWPGTIWFVIDIVLLLFAVIGAHMLFLMGKDSFNNVERDYENNFF